MHNRSSNRRRRPVLALLIALALLAPSVLANAQSEEPVDGAVTTVSLSMTIVELVDSGRIWIDAEGYHVRDAVTTALVEGDITGVAELVSGIDQYGPCSGPLDCDGEQETFSEIRIEGEDQIWSGQLALETASESGSPVHGMLVGRHGALDKIIVLDTLVGLEGDTLELAGNMVTLLGPTGALPDPRRPTAGSSARVDSSTTAAPSGSSDNRWGELLQPASTESCARSVRKARCVVFSLRTSTTTTRMERSCWSASPERIAAFWATDGPQQP
jgi:hypothetical protein